MARTGTARLRISESSVQSMATANVMGPTYMGSCQNYGPFLGPFHNTAPII